MVTYVTSEEIIGIVISLLQTVNVPKYPRTKPSLAQPTEYITVNTLGLNANTMQKCRVNVNYHVKDINMGSTLGVVPDMAKLDAGSKAVLALLTKVTSSNYMIDHEGSELIPEMNQSEHYSNLKFSFKYINQNG